MKVEMYEENDSDEDMDLNQDNFASQFRGLEEDEDEDADPFEALFEDDEEMQIRMNAEENGQTGSNRSGMAHRGTFVGTPLYASPEMLNNSSSGPFTDLWALGVIIFQILAGEVPWKGSKDYIIFQQILERRIAFPNNMSPEAIDLIDELLCVNPLRRLGCGAPGSDNDYKALKEHKFFAGLNFDRVKSGSISPPIQEALFNNIPKEEEKPK